MLSERHHPHHAPTGPTTARRLQRICALGAVLLIAAPATAGAVGWITSGPETPSGRVARDPVIAETADGTRVLAWQQAGSPATPASINVRVAPPHEDFGTTQTIPDDSAAQPSLAVGPDGTVALVWEDFPANVPTIRIDRLAPRARTFVDVPGTPAGGNVDSPLQTVVAGGDIFVAYQLIGTQATATVTSIDAVRLPANAATIQHVPGPTSPDIERAMHPTAGPASGDANPTIAAQGNTVYVGWELDIDGGPGAQTSATQLRVAQYSLASPPGATFTAPVLEATVTTPGTRAEAILPQLTAAAGHVNVVWRQSDSGPLNYRDVTAGHSAPTRSIASGGVDTFQASTAGDGTMIVAWQRFDAPHATNIVFASAVPAGETAATSPQRITPVNANRILAGLVTAADGRALIITNREDEDGSDANDEQVQAAVRPRGGTFGALEEVSGPQDHSPAASFDSVSGTFGAPDEVLIAWGKVQQSATPGDEIFISSHDASPPTIAALGVPSTTSAGIAMAVSVHATDTQSAVSVEWQFGDGSSATGPRATHTYGTPGRYTVTVAATDAAGNTTTADRTIIVRASGDAAAPQISSFAVTHHRFRAGTTGTPEIARVRTAPLGTAFHLRINERATIAIVLTRADPRHRTAEIGSLVRAGRGPGAVAIGFSGRLGSLRLAPGRYTAHATAVNAAGKRSRPATVNFEVVA